MKYNIFFDVAALFVNLILILLTCFRQTPPKTKKTIFRAMLISTFLATICDILATYTISYPQKFTLSTNYLINILYYIFHNLSAFLYVAYGVASDGHKVNNKKKNLIILIIFLFVMSSIITTPYTKLVFYFDENINYKNGPFLYVLYSISLIFVAYVTYLKISNKENQSTFQITTNIGYTIALFGAFVYHLINSEILIELFAITCGYLVMYVSLDNPEQYLYKTLNVYNRRAFEDYVHHIAVKKNQFQILIFTPHDDEKYKKTFSRSQMFAMEKALINVVNKERSNLFFVYSDSMFAKVCTDYKEEIRKINERLKDPIVVNDKQYEIKMSYGVIRFPEIAQSSDDLFVLLEDLIYRVNDNISSEAIEVNPELLLDEQKRNIAEILTDAIKNDKFFIEYEPVFDTNNANALNAEAILMLKNEENESPVSDEYYSVAEGCGLIVDIDEIFLKKVGDFIAKSNIQNFGLNNIIVDLSLAELTNINLINRFNEIVKKYNIPCKNICFKLVDLDLSINGNIITKNINEFARMGFKFVVDNYGSNSTNLSKMLGLPILGIKFSENITKEALSDPGKNTIFEGLVKIIKELNYVVACSGITSLSEDNLMKKNKIDYVQGPFYGGRMKDDDFISFYKTQLMNILSLINRN